MSHSTFLITGLPRSRTAWLAAFFSGRESFCYHEATRYYRSPSLLMDHLETKPIGWAGNADSGLMLWPKALAAIAKHRSRVALIRRPIKEVRHSLKASFDWELPSRVVDLYIQVGLIPNIRHFDFHALDDPMTIRDMWSYLVPGCAWDQKRYELFRGLKIEVDSELYLQEMKQCLGSQVS